MKRAYAPDAFDKIEIASVIKTALINPDSFQMVLHMFDNLDDRLNLCHRLNIPEEMAYSETVTLAMLRNHYLLQQRCRSNSGANGGAEKDNIRMKRRFRG